MNVTFGMVWGGSVPILRGLGYRFSGLERTFASNLMLRHITRNLTWVRFNLAVPVYEIFGDKRPSLYSLLIERWRFLDLLHMLVTALNGSRNLKFLSIDYTLRNSGIYLSDKIDLRVIFR